MIKIYFDGVLLDNRYYMGFNYSYEMFEKEFYLGSTGSLAATLTIPKVALPQIPTIVSIAFDNDLWMSLVIDSIEETDNEEYKLTLTDKLVDTEVEYDFSNDVPISAKTLLENICTEFLIPHDTFNFTNQDVTISAYDNTITAREYIGMIAELAGGYAIIDENDKLQIKTFLNQTPTNIITADDVDTFKIKNTITIQRVVWQFVANKFESSSDESLYTIYLDGNNLFLQNMTQEIFTNICNNIIGLTISNIKIPTTNKFFKEKDLIKFIDRDTTEYIILPQYEADYLGGFIGSYDSNIDNGKQNETKVKTTATKVKRIKQVVDQDNATLMIAVQDITYQKEVTNLGLQQAINANTTLINQTASEIRTEVSETAGNLQGNIDILGEDLENTEEALQGQIQQNSTRITQLANSITNTVKSIGGNNLLRNSVGFATTLDDNDNKTLDFWTETTPGHITSIQDADTEATTSSGSKIQFNGSAILAQDYVTQIGMVYGISFKLKHIINGGTADSIRITLSGDGATPIEILDSAQQTREYSTFTQFSEFTYIATITSPKIIITVTGDDIIEISDLIISQGENQAWSCYYDEVYGKEHRLDKFGLKLSDLGTGDYSQETVRGLKFTENSEVVAEISKNRAKSDSAEFTNSMTIRKLKTVALDDNNIIEYIE